MDEISEKQYVRVARALNRVLKGLNMFSLPGNIRTFKAEVDQNLTIEVDSGVSDVFKVGVPSGNERIKILRNRKIWRPSEMEGCSCSSSTTESCDSCLFHGFYINGMYGEVFGAYTEQFPGEWEYDADNDRLILSGLAVGATVYYEAKTSGDVNMIPEEAFMLVRARTMEVLSGSDPRLKESYRLDAARELTVLKRAKLERSYEEFYAMLRGNSKRAKY